MSFYPYLKGIGEELPKFSMTEAKQNSGFSLEKVSEEASEVSDKIYQCPVCHSRFIYLTSFIKTCRKHWSGVNKEILKKRHLEQDSSREKQIKQQRKDKGAFSRRSIAKLPKGHVYYCKLCQKTFTLNQIYKAHMLGHENPLIKCCQICEMEFSDFTYANNHKKRFHPKLYVDEMRERAAERKKNGVKKVVYHTIPISMAPDRCGPEVPKSKPFEIVLDRICLPGFQCDDWISLPENEKDYPWLVEKVKVEVHPNQVLEQITLVPRAINNENVREEKSDPDPSQLDGYVSDPENDFDWPMMDEETNEESINDTKVVPVDKNTEIRKYFIQPEEIPDIPQFLGAKYIFNVYNKRNIHKKRMKKQGPQLINENDETKKPKNKSPYKQSSVQCKICGENRSRSNIRAHIVTHHYEEDETVCRICGYTVTAPRIFRQHYKLKHDVLFREYLMKLQREKMEKEIDAEIASDYVTCNVCYTNMKTKEHLNFHYDMLHNYDTQGGRKSSKSRECLICGKKFQRRQYLLIHMRRTHKQVPTPQVFCHYCGKGE